MVELKVTEEMGIIGIPLRDMGSKLISSILIGVVIRNEEVIVPNGDFVIEENDRIYVIGKPSNLYNFCKMSGKCPQKIRNVMIAGGGRIAIYLAKLLSEMDIKVKLIEFDREKCIQLSELLPEALIIHGDGTDEELLKSENVSDMDGFISMTGMDEENLMSALLAKQNGVKKVIAKVSRVNYINIIKSLGVDSVISPKLITTNHILKFVRGNNIESLYRIIEGQAEITEIIADSASDILNIKIKKLGLPKDVIIATIVRKKEVVIPHGNDIIREGDRVIVISKNKNISSLNEVAANSAGGF